MKTVSLLLGLSHFFLCIFLLSLPEAVAQKSLRDFGAAPEFSGIDSEGNNFSSSEKLEDKISLVNFFFTSCQGPCPALMLRMKRIIDSVSPKCDSVHVVSVSVDPERDTTEVLSEYASTRGYTNDNWTLLQMKDDLVIDLLNNGFKLGTGGDLINHSTRIVLVDKDKKIRALIPGMDEDTIEQAIEYINQLCE